MTSSWSLFIQLFFLNVFIILMSSSKRKSKSEWKEKNLFHNIVNRKVTDSCTWFFNMGCLKGSVKVYP